MQLDGDEENAIGRQPRPQSPLPGDGPVSILPWLMPTNTNTTTTRSYRLGLSSIIFIVFVLGFLALAASCAAAAAHPANDDIYLDGQTSHTHQDIDSVGTLATRNILLAQAKRSTRAVHRDDDEDEDDDEDDDADDYEDEFDQGSGHSQNPFEANEIDNDRPPGSKNPKEEEETDHITENEVTLTTTTTQSTTSLANESRECPAGRFACRSGTPPCLEQAKQCDGVSECEDGSDELDCYDAGSSSSNKEIECRAFEDFKCTNGKQCVALAKRCDQHLDCLDGSDEFECECSATQFQCTKMFECIERRYRCDRKYDCQDGTDERNCETNICEAGEFRCQTGQCIASASACNLIKDCADGSDETACAKECKSTEFACADGLECIARESVCNEQYDCSDGSDELNCQITAKCGPNMFRCRDGQCIPAEERCNFHKECYDGSDEFECKIICNLNEFECHTDGRCIKESLRCDGFYDCLDFSDEQNCENRTCRLSQFRCNTGLCIDRALLCNGQSDCPDRTDELECWLCPPGKYNCANGQCVDMGQRCDGRGDCKDLSDEADCGTNQVVNLQVYPERQSIRQGQEAVFRCRDESESRLPVQWVREGRRPLPLGANDNRGRLSLINIQPEHSGVYVCIVLHEQQNVFIHQKAAYLTVLPTFDYEIMINHSPQNDHQDNLVATEDDTTETKIKSNCGADSVPCTSGGCVLKQYLCDGQVDCADQSDEQNCERPCKANQFACANGKCVYKHLRCDARDDCGDGSDERDCEDVEDVEWGRGDTTCKADEYQCVNGNQCVPRSLQCDFQFDCQDKSDEIGCSPPTIIEHSKSIITITEGEKVTLTCRSIGIPTPIINWRLNMQHVPSPPRVTMSSVDGYGRLVIRDASQADQGAYTCEAMNTLKPSVIAPNHTLLIVKPINLLCQPPTFNDLASDISECLRCFCFGASEVCHSSSVQTSAIRVAGAELSVVPMQQENGTYYDMSHLFPPIQSAIQFDRATSMHSINSEVAAAQTPDYLSFYWRLPAAFLGNQLLSYGGYLRYSIRYREPFSPSPLQIPDVILRGNGITLYHYEKNFMEDSKENISISIRFWVGEWFKDDRNAFSHSTVFEDTTREDIMIVLQNVEEVLIKATYDAHLLETSIFNIQLESAIVSNVSDAQRSAYIEQCSCPDGYLGSSCEQCAPNYIRHSSGQYLGRCLPAPRLCNCNGHSEECDQYSGHCVNCRDHTEGKNCEKCERGFYLNPKAMVEDTAQCTVCPCQRARVESNLTTSLSEDLGDLPEKWLLVPCSYNATSDDVVCELCPLGYEGRLCEECARDYVRRLDANGEIICRLKDECADGQFRCGNGTCIDKSHRCDQVTDCLPDGIDEFGCQCNHRSFRCGDGTCLEPRLHCNGVANCNDNSDEEHCHSHGTDTCHPFGSITSEPNELTKGCQCRPLVTEPLCDTCRPGSFNLNEHSPQGCIECFCFGVTRSCSGAFHLYRDYIELKMNQYNHGIVVRDLTNTTHLAINRLGFDHINHELVLHDLLNYRTDLYWQLPYQFLGNRVHSYGGAINYTFKFQGNYFVPSANNAPDVVMRGNNITLFHRFGVGLEPQKVHTVSVMLFETQWTLANEVPATRKEVMLVLSRLELMLLRATLTDNVRSVSLAAVTLDTAAEMSTNMKELIAVRTVEECQCPYGYKGTSCERCAHGFRLKRMVDEEQTADIEQPDLERLVSCEPCSCHGHSNECDPDTGVCVNCQHNTAGAYCEQCLPGYLGNALHGTPSDCYLDKVNRERNDTSTSDCSSCNVEGIKDLDYCPNGVCECKANVEGDRCDICREGYFFLNTNNPGGCLECFCSGVAKRCTSNSYYWSTIELLLANVYPPDAHKFELTNRFRTNFYTDRIHVNPYHNELYFYSLFWIHERKGDSNRPETLFWSLPSQFLGNRLTSYGGRLRYKQRYVTQASGEFINDADILLVGNGIILQYVHPEVFAENEEITFVVELAAESGRWQKIDQRSQASGVANRIDFVRALSNLEMIGIRATFHTQMKDSYLRDVSIDVATPDNASGDLALTVEQCFCPAGYIGLSCEQCAPGYIQEKNVDGLYRCVRCQCNSHSSTCDLFTGKCANCQHNTVGDHCERCAAGFYGDATRGELTDCRPCPCPSVNLSNNFSPTCFADTDNQPTCNDCQHPYTGRNCERCVHGYRGNPTVPGGKCELFNTTQTIRVEIEGPRARHVATGATVVLRCSASSQVTGAEINLGWIKLNAELPVDFSEASGVLTLPNIQPDDAGVYVCTASDLDNVARAHVIVHVKSSAHTSVPKVRIEPSRIEAYVGDPVTFKCIADGEPQPRLFWSMMQSQITSPMSSFSPETGVFFIPSVQRSDEAEYLCQATNSVGSDSAKAVLFVQSRDYHPLEYHHVDGIIPTAKVSPANHSSLPGENARLECNITGQPVPTIRWIFSGGGPNGQLPGNVREIGTVLLLSRVTPDNSGVYTCIASNSLGTAEAQSRVLVITNQRALPTVVVEPIQQTIVQGHTGELQCITNGLPRPTITWHKFGGHLDRRHKVIDNKLIIERMEAADRGYYICKAENSEGINQASALVEIEMRIVPSIEIFPQPSQIVRRGSSTYFQCRTMKGIPEPTVEWRRLDGSPFTPRTDINRGLLQFREISAQDEGTYECIAENIAGRVTALATLKIDATPRVKIYQTTPYRVRQNEFVKLECHLVSAADSPVQLTWHKLKMSNHNHSLYVLPAHPVEKYQDRAVLEFRSIKPIDTGIYVCTGTSALGSSEERIQVLVEEPTPQMIPHVFIEEKVVTVVAGSRAELRCFVRGTDRPILIKWVRPDRQKSLPEMSQIENGTLTIDQAKLEDAGDYDCLGVVVTAQGHERVLFQDRARLAVVAPPEIQIEPLLQSVSPGGTVEIVCVVSDLAHLATIHWSRIGSHLPTSVAVEADGARLVIGGVHYTDAGKYLCTAANLAGKAQAYSEVVVTSAPAFTMPPPPLTPPPMSVVAEPIKTMVTIAGSNFDLVCPLEAYGEGIIEWQYSVASDYDPRLPNNVHKLGDGRLRINNVRPDNAGQYLCERAPSQQSVIVLKVEERRSNIEVKISPSKEVVYLDDNVTLACSVVGDANAHLVWSHLNSKQLAQPLADNVAWQGDTLHIVGVRPENSGVYRCNVDTFGGHYTAEYILIIQLPALSQSPSLVEKHFVKKEESVLIPCDAVFSPGAEVQWKRYRAVESMSRPEEEVRLPQTSKTFANGSLLITSAVFEHSGVYVCLTATNQSVNIVSVQSRVPRFGQSALSYLSFATLKNAYRVFNITLEVRPEKADGLILYNGQHKTSGDFISLGMRAGHVEFRFELGAGVTVLRSEHPLAVHRWHSIAIWRKDNIGKLKVDNQMIVSSSGPPGKVGLDLAQPLYLGGVANFSEVIAHSGFETSFHGCISRLTSGTKVYDLIKESIANVGVENCEETDDDDDDDDDDDAVGATSGAGQTCSGGVCGEVRPTCTSYECGLGLCSLDRQHQVQCLCPFGTGGEHCEKKIQITRPHFNGRARLQTQLVPAHVIFHLNLRLRLRPSLLEADKNYLLLFASKNVNHTGDFIALTINNSRVQFAFDTGSGEAVLQHPTELVANDWVDVVVERHETKAALKVGRAAGEPAQVVKGRTPGSRRGLNLLPTLYVGGLSAATTANQTRGHFDNFHGCIETLSLNGKRVDLIAPDIASTNVQDCGPIAYCPMLQPCGHGGTCSEVPARHDYECQCSADYKGKNCEKQRGECEKGKLCENGGECYDLDDGKHECDCAIGFGGQNCGTVITFDTPYEAYMNQRSYVSFDNSYLAQLDNKTAMFTVQTKTPDGLLFFYGIDFTPSAFESNLTGKDYLISEMFDGKVLVKFELGSGEGKLESNVTINDGQPHLVQIRLHHNHCELRIDQHHVFAAHSPGNLTTLNAKGDIYLGGLPGRTEIKGFTGCMWNIEIGLSGIINLFESAKGSRNILPCYV